MSNKLKMCKSLNLYFPLYKQRECNLLYKSLKFKKILLFFSEGFTRFEK